MRYETPVPQIDAGLFEQLCNRHHSCRIAIDPAERMVVEFDGTNPTTTVPSALTAEAVLELAPGQKAEPAHPYTLDPAERLIAGISNHHSAVSIDRRGNLKLLPGRTPRPLIPTPFPAQRNASPSDPLL